MSCEISICRAVGRISLSEWKAAVAATEGVRLRTGDTSITNPKTGEVISIPNPGGDADVFLADRGEWAPVFGWRPGAGDVTFKATRELSDPDCAVVKIARRLASHLGAHLVGDGGERCDHVHVRD